jgi:hypothetical protein
MIDWDDVRYFLAVARRAQFRPPPGVFWGGPLRPDTMIVLD